MKFRVNCEKNPFRIDGHKFQIFQWCIEKGEFSKEEFLLAEKEIHVRDERKSKMSDEIRSKAWWNELRNKHKAIEII